MAKWNWQHVLLIIVGAIVTIGPDVAVYLGSEGLTGSASTVTHVVGLVTVFLSIIKRAPVDTSKVHGSGAIDNEDRPKPPDAPAAG